MRVSRFDFAGPARRVMTTPQGGLCVEAAIARAGVLDYSDGTRSWREYRPAEEVFKADSMATAQGGPVTDLHPPKLVTPETFAAVSRGHARDDVRRDGDLLVVDLMVQDAALCALVEAGERREVSCGYTCVVVPTPGVTPEGERYDAIQTQIVHNHVALLPPGTGRSGPEVSLRMDGAAVEVRRDAAGDSMKKITLKGGRVIKLDAAEDEGAAQCAVDDMQKKADADGAELTAVKNALMDALQKVAALEAKQAAADAATPPPVTEDTVPEEVQDSIIKNRGALVATARTVLGAEAKLDGLKATEIRRLVIGKAMPEIKLDGLSADTLGGMFLAVTSGAATRTDALGRARAPLGHDTTRTDSTDDEGTPAGLARRTSEAWRTSTQTTGARGANGSR